MFWIKIFSVSFGMGVVSGIVMPFQFGTNWSRFSDVTANVLSPLFAYEAIMAFFLESAFLGVLLFGRKLVPQWAHFFAALMVAFGTLLSSFWILSANSWMQTPVGYELIDGRFFPKDWFQIVFNPSFPYRLTHTIVAFYVTTAFVVAAPGGLSDPRRSFRRRRPRHVFDDAVAPERPCAAANPAWRLARTQYAQTSTRKARCDRGSLGNGEPSSTGPFCHSRRGQ